LSLRDAAAAASISASTLSRWETGNCVPRVPELKALLRAFGIAGESIQRILVSIDAPRAAKAARKTLMAANLESSQSLVPTGGDLIRAMRLRKRLTITLLADQLGVNPSTVSRWENSIARPSMDLIKLLHDTLEATSEEQACLIESGVAKIKVDRPAFEARLIEGELKTLERRFLAEEWTNLELRILQLQSMLWWYCEDITEAAPLLAWSQTLYAEFLVKNERWTDAARQAEAALALLDGNPEHRDLSVLAAITLARCEVYGAAQPQPHVGLVLLNRWKEVLPEGTGRGRVFAEIAKYAYAIRDFECASRYAGESLRIAAKAGDLRLNLETSELRKFEPLFHFNANGEASSTPSI
jgi:transcriptional regulator with XRE-family HTH domain